MMVETYLRRGQRRLERMALDPKVRTMAAVAMFVGSGFLLSAVGLGKNPQPVAMGLICSAVGWRALLMALGAMLGYPTFWGSEGNMGIVWSAAGGVLAMLVGHRRESREQPLMIPCISAFLTVVTGVGFHVILKEQISLVQLPLQASIALFSGILFTQAARCRDAITDWLVAGVSVLALARVSLGPHLVLGYLAAGFLGVGAAFPAAALAGAALDLSRLTQVPMTAVMCLTYFLRMIPYDRRWKQGVTPAAAFLIVSIACSIRDPTPLAGLVLGGACGLLLPPKPQIAHRRGETGGAQVRLELSAELFSALQQMILELKPPPVDQEAILERARQQACGSCALRRTCVQQRCFGAELLENPLEADCRKQSILVPELRRAGQQLRILQADRKRQAEYRAALSQQYRFLSLYLRDLSDRLPRRAEHPKAEFRIELSARSHSRESANGDRCFAFSGADCRYFVVLCDGMGTGLGAAQEGEGAGKLLRQILQAGFPAEYALKTLNSLLSLQEKAGAVSVDLAEISLETGIAYIYKWGAAPSWVLHRRGMEKIGTATPPPGISVESVPMAVEKLSLRRGEVLILVSDGVNGALLEDLSDASPDAPLRELAVNILEQGCAGGEDDATAALVRLRPAGMPTS